MNTSDEQTPLMRALDALCAENNVTRRSLSLKAGMSDSAIKHIARGASRSPKVDTLVRLANAASAPFYMFLGNHGLRAELVESLDNPKAGPVVGLADSPAQITQTPEEAEWLGAWRDMNEGQRRRAVALLRALIESDAA